MVSAHRLVLVFVLVLLYHYLYYRPPYVLCLLMSMNSLMQSQDFIPTSRVFFESKYVKYVMVLARFVELIVIIGNAG